MTLEQQQALALARARLKATSDIPTPMSAKAQSIPDNSKLVNFLSGGKSGNWEQYLYNNEPPADSFLGKTGQLLDASGIAGLAPEVDRKSVV